MTFGLLSWVRAGDSYGAVVAEGGGGTDQAGEAEPQAQRNGDEGGEIP